MVAMPQSLQDAARVTGANPTGPKPVLLVAGDEGDLAMLIRDIATQVGFDARLVTSGYRFKELVTALPVQVAIADQIMHDCDGLELVQFLAEQHTPCGLILMGAPEDRYLRAAQMLASAWHVNLLGILVKPVRAADLIAVLHSAMAQVQDTGATIHTSSSPSIS